MWSKNIVRMWNERCPKNMPKICHSEHANTQIGWLAQLPCGAHIAPKIEIIAFPKCDDTPAATLISPSIENPDWIQIGQCACAAATRKPIKHWYCQCVCHGADFIDSSISLCAAFTVLLLMVSFHCNHRTTRNVGSICTIPFIICTVLDILLCTENDRFILYYRLFSKMAHCRCESISGEYRMDFERRWRSAFFHFSACQLYVRHAVHVKMRNIVYSQHVFHALLGDWYVFTFKELFFFSREEL